MRNVKHTGQEDIRVNNYVGHISVIYYRVGMGVQSDTVAVRTLDAQVAKFRTHCHPSPQEALLSLLW